MTHSHIRMGAQKGDIDVAGLQVCRRQCNGQSEKRRYSIKAKAKRLPLNVDRAGLAAFREVIPNELEGTSEKDADSMDFIKSPDPAL